MKNTKKDSIENNYQHDSHKIFLIGETGKDDFRLRMINKTKLLLENNIQSAWNNFKSWSTSFRGKLILFCIVAISIIPLLTPFFSQLEYLTGILILSMIFAIYAASWDLISGVTGQISFGHSIFLGIGGYSTAIFVSSFGLHWLVSMFLGAIFSVISGLIVGIPSLRLKGPYFASATMALSLIFQNIFYYRFVEVLGGTGGITGVPKISDNIITEYFITLLFTIICVTIILAIYNSNFGTVLKAIRDDDISAEASGINLTKNKLIAFMISGFFGGIAGSLYTFHLHSINPAIYLPINSFFPILMTFIGGIATISGGVFGAFFYWILTEMLRDFGAASLLIFAIILILVIRFAKRGLLIAIIEKLQNFLNILLGR